MKRYILTFAVAFAAFFTAPLRAHNDLSGTVDIQKLDRYFTKHKAQPRPFRTKEEFKKMHTHPKPAKHDKHLRTHRPVSKQYQRYMTGSAHYRPNNRYYDDYYDGMLYDTMPRRQFETPYLRPRRGWILAYRYDRADFFDRDGFHYGYFNRYGYLFEGVFYRYDYRYTYRDRLMGRGLFDRYYYRPAAWREYGFCR